MHLLLGMLPALPCQVPGLGCFGCCGQHYESREEVLLGIRKNTLTWQEEQAKDPADRLSLRDFCWLSEIIDFWSPKNYKFFMAAESATSVWRVC